MTMRETWWAPMLICWENIRRGQLTKRGNGGLQMLAKTGDRWRFLLQRSKGRMGVSVSRRGSRPKYRNWSVLWLQEDSRLRPKASRTHVCTIPVLVQSGDFSTNQGEEPQRALCRRRARPARLWRLVVPSLA